MSCTNTAAQTSLERLFAGDLPDDELVALRAHAATCDECRASYDRLTRVQATLEKSRSGLPADRLKFLESQVLARAAQSSQAAPYSESAPPGTSWWQRLRFVLLPAGGLALAGLLVAVVVPRVQHDTPEWQARGVDPQARANAAFGVRAFCVTRDADPKVQAQAAPGESLKCAPGMAVQFTYTAPRDARLSIAAPIANGDPVTFLAASDPQAQVKAGIDQALSFSTVVTGDWLSAPVDVHARFEDPQSGKLLSDTTVRLVPESEATSGAQR